MSKTLRYIMLLTGVILANISLLNSQILQEEQYLEGNWKFSIGDDESWKSVDFDDSDWTSIRVPSSWESQGFNDYNGYAWYRRKIKIEQLPQHDMIIKIGCIDDADEVYFNGRFVGKNGGFPPYVKTAYEKERIYTIPKSYWRKGENVIAIRVYDFYNEGGVISGPVKLYSDITSSLLSINLAGQWKFKVHNQTGAEKADFNDTSWSHIRVPSMWEKEGWENYDGVAWYRKSFDIPEHLVNQELILLLGKIDDSDKTWFNGTKIGGVSPGNLRSSLARGLEGTYDSYTTIRAYKIPQSSIVNGKNTIAVRVVDTGIDGGIYQGIIGIMTRDQFDNYTELVKKEPDLFNLFWNWIKD